MLVKEKKSSISLDQMHTNPKVTDELCRIGVPMNIKGFAYAVTGITLLQRDYETYSNSLVKDLYPAIAEVYNTTPSRVERAIRHAVGVLFDRSTAEDIEKYFGNSVNPYKGRLTNSEFLCLMAYRIK